MKIKTLTIHGFGQFVNRTFEFNDGLNLIHGLNESGKTTIHAFIEAMFYGFINPSIKVKKTLDIYDRYEPKHSDTYGGSMVIEHEGKDYRIERNLKKRNRDPLRVINEKTGVDITDTLDIDPVAKTADIAAFVNIPYTLYQNTLSIRQLELETEASVGDILMSRLSNMLQTKTETISPETARDILKKDLDAIGSERASTKPYAQTLSTLEALKKEQRVIEKTHALLLEDKAILETKKREQITLEESLDSHKQMLAKKENSLKRNRFDTIQKLIQEKNQLETKHEALKEVQDFNPQDVERFYVASERLTTHKETKQSLDHKYTQLAADVNETAKVQTPPAYSYQAILHDLKALKTLNELFDEPMYKTTKQTIDRLKHKHAQWSKKDKNISKTRQWAKKHWYILLLPLIFMLFALPIKWWRMKKRQKYEHLLAFAQAQERTLEAPKILSETLLKKHGINDMTTFEFTYIDQAREQETIKKHHEQKVRELKTLKQEINRVNDQINHENKVINTIKETYDVLTYDDLKAIRDKYHQYQKLTSEIKTYETRIKDYLGTTTLTTLESSIDFDLERIDTTDIDALRQEVDDLRKKLNHHKLNTQTLKQTIDTKEQSMRPLEDVLFDIESLDEKRKRLESKRTTIERALERIDQAVEKIEENFAPKLSESIGHYLTTFTSERYRDIRVSKALDFKVFDQRYNRLESKMHFSRGTIDQVYFAMRLGMLDSLNQKSAPLLLDDAFVSYDDERLNHVLTVLDTMQNERQILLFSCQSREAATLDALRITYHKETLNSNV